jgi:hypothetical protein
MNNTPQLKGTAIHFIEQYRYSNGNETQTCKLPLNYLREQLAATKSIKGKTIAVWHITPHPFIDINQFKTN